jgi:uncharacterized membrane protein (UPF0127 family)
VSRRKRSGRLTFLVFLLLVGCSGPDVVSFGEFDPVAVARSEAARAAGVTAVPLAAGESLGFVFDDAERHVFTMVGVAYGLDLVGLSASGEILEVVSMDPGECCYTTATPTRVYVEVRR